MVGEKRKQERFRGRRSYSIGLPAFHDSDVHIWKESTHVGCKEGHDEEI
jgi:hypothetical protein